MNTKEFFAALELLEKEKGISKDIIGNIKTQPPVFCGSLLYGFFISCPIQIDEYSILQTIPSFHPIFESRFHSIYTVFTLSVVSTGWLFLMRRGALP